MAQWLLKHRPTTLAGCCFVLTLAVTVAFTVVAGVAFQLHGRTGVLAALVAAAVCWLSAVLAISLTALFRGPQGALYGLLFGMLFRMGLPLGAALVLSRNSATLAGAGVVGSIAAFY